MDILNYTTKASLTRDKYDLDLDDPELMNIGVDDYLIDLPNNNLLNQSTMTQPVLQSLNLFSQPVFNPCEEIIDEIIDDNDGNINRYDTVVGMNKTNVNSNSSVMGMLSPQGYTSSEETNLAGNSPLFMDSMKSSFPLTPPPQQVPYKTNINTTNSLYTVNNFNSIPSYSNVNPIKMESMDSFNELDKYQKGRYRIVRDSNDEKPTVQLVLNNHRENYTQTMDNLMNNYITLNAAQSKNTGVSSTCNKNADSSSSAKTMSTQSVVIKREEYNNSHSDNRSNYFNSDINYNTERKNCPSTSPSDNKISFNGPQRCQQQPQSQGQSQPPPLQQQQQQQQNNNYPPNYRNYNSASKNNSIRNLVNGYAKNEAELEQMQDKFKEMSLSKSKFNPSIQNNKTDHPNHNSSSNNKTSNNHQNQNGSIVSQNQNEKMEEHKMFIQRLMLILRQTRIQIPNLLLSPTLPS